MTTEGAGLFLDLDGTLANSLAVMRGVYDRFLEHFGKRGSDAEFAAFNGPPLVQIVTGLAGIHRIERPVPELTEFYWSLIHDFYRDVSPCEGALDLVSCAKGSGFAVAVVTSNAADLARVWLGRAGLAPFVDAIVGGSEVKHGKPDPEPYLLALARTNCLAARSFAVEDSVSGVRSALGAGLTTFRLSDQEGDHVGPGIVVRRLSEVTPFLTAGRPGSLA